MVWTELADDDEFYCRAVRPGLKFDIGSFPYQASLGR